MRNVCVVMLFLAITVTSCGPGSAPPTDQPSQTPPVAADNSGLNARDRDDAKKTADDQSGSEADRTISQNIRQSIVKDDTMSINGKNVKIITVDGLVTLRGPVKSEAEKRNIETKAQQIAGVKRVDNQLEIAK